MCSLYFRRLDNEIRTLHAYASGFVKYFQSDPAEIVGQISTIIYSLYILRIINVLFQINSWLMIS
jgi:hypothetical protein